MTTTSLVPLTQYLLAAPSSSRLAAAVAASDGAILAARELYHARGLEPLLVGVPLVLHVASGVAARLVRWRQNLRRYGGATPGVRALARQRDAAAAAARLSKEESSGGWGGRSERREAAVQSAWPHTSYVALAGYALVPLVFAHAFVNRAVPLRHPAAGDSSAVTLAYVSHGFARHAGTGAPRLLGVAVWAFYVALVAVGAGHIVWGWARWLGVESAVLGTGPEGVGRRRKAATGSGDAWEGGVGAVDAATRRRRKRSWWTVQGVAVTVAAAWAAGGLGVVARAGAVPGWIGRLYDSLYESVGL
jgi:hypothetical protein